MATVRIEIKAEHNVNLPGVGHVVGEVDYFLGTSDSRHHTGEEPEVENIDLRLASGEELEGAALEALFDSEASYDALTEAVGVIYSEIDAEWARQESERLKEEDFDLPNFLTI